MPNFIRVISLVTAIIAGLAVSGCNTMRGFGKDVERGGERVQDAAQPKEATPQKTR